MILVVAGPSGSGKSLMLDVARRSGAFERPVASTTRAQRPEEVDGRDYWFVSRPEFRRDIRAGRFVDWDYTIDNYYGYDADVSRFAVEAAAIVAVTARVGLRLWARLANVHLVFLDGRSEALEGRVAARGATREELLLRQLHAREEREHSPLFHERIRPPAGWAEDEIMQLLARIRRRFP